MKKELMKEAVSDEAAVKRLVDIVKILRKECPWDREQTHESLKVCLIEEAYEVIEAIDKKDDDNLREELGDVMLQVVFHGSLAEEREGFSLKDICNEECEKMIRRHPHVFSDESLKTVDKVLEKWENVKWNEHKYSSYSEELAGVPQSLPALMRSAKVQKKAAKVGFDWDDAAGAVEKLHEEINEFIVAHESGSYDDAFEEMGDLLFTIVNVSRFLKIDPEQALTKSTEKFINRFTRMEELALSKGLKLDDMTLEEMDVLWDEVKKS